MYEFVYLLKTLAALLITNSHFDKLYPVSYLSIGGSLGNTLFFLAAGFLLSSQVNNSFPKWIFSRIKRLYPPLWIMTVFLICTGYLSPTSLEEVLIDFFFPYKAFWFIPAILCFYALFWFVVRTKVSYWFVSGVLLYAVWYANLDTTSWVVEDGSFFKYVFYFLVMLVGYSFKNKKTVDIVPADKKILTMAIITVLSLGAYVGLKLLVNGSAVMMQMQFMVQVATLLFGVACFNLLYFLEEKIKQLRERKIWKVPQIIGESTLEIYLVNAVVITNMEKVFFPVNVIFAMLLILVIDA